MIAARLPRPRPVKEAMSMPNCMSATIRPPSRRLCTPRPCAKNEGSSETKMAKRSPTNERLAGGDEERPADRGRNGRKLRCDADPRCGHEGTLATAKARPASKRCRPKTPTRWAAARIQRKRRRSAHRMPSRRWFRRSRASRQAGALLRPSIRERPPPQSEGQSPSATP